MNIDSHLPPSQLVVTPVRPDPVPPGQETVRPTPTPNGAEAGARHPLQDNQRENASRADARNRQDAGQENATRTGARAGDNQALTEAQKREVQQLKSRDTEVRNHEAAHKAAAGGLAQGSASFEYQVGPDGRHYAVGGEVSIDTSRSGDPRKDLEKAQTIRQAALAPAAPSAQDRRVAAEAMAMEAEARQELQAARTERLQQGGDDIGAGDEAANDPINPGATERTVSTVAPSRIGERIDVFA